MVTYTKVIGLMEKHPEKVFSSTEMGACMKVIGIMMLIMEKVKNTGIIAKSNIQGISLKARKQAVESLNSMAIGMKDNSWRVNSMDKANITLLIQRSSIPALLLQTKCTAKAKWFGQTNHSTLDFSKTEC